MAVRVQQEMPSLWYTYPGMVILYVYPLRRDHLNIHPTGVVSPKGDICYVVSHISKTKLRNTGKVWFREAGLSKEGTTVFIVEPSDVDPSFLKNISSLGIESDMYL